MLEIDIFESFLISIENFSRVSTLEIKKVCIAKFNQIYNSNEDILMEYS